MARERRGSGAARRAVAPLPELQVAAPLPELQEWLRSCDDGESDAGYQLLAEACHSRRSRPQDAERARQPVAAGGLTDDCKCVAP